MNKMRRNLINLRWNLIKYIQFDGFINDVMFYFYLVAVMVGITGDTVSRSYHKTASLRRFSNGGVQLSSEWCSFWLDCPGEGVERDSTE